MKLWKRLGWMGFYGVTTALLCIVASNVWVVNSTSSDVLTDYRQLPDSGVALVLGTSHRLASGLPNPFFENRMATAGTLFREGKIIHFILSGDNRTRYYNEPNEMKKALMKQGVPQTSITLDYAGLRTLDSIVRSKEIFGQDKIVIITQPFHSYRALFISRYYKIKAVALVAEEPSQESAIKVYMREYLARTKAILDLYILHTEPQHLGAQEPLSL
jgi:SanA protein